MSFQSELLRKHTDGTYIHDDANLTLLHAHRGDTGQFFYDEDLGVCVRDTRLELIEEMPNPVLAEGIWCEGCDYFEQDVEIEKDSCPSCGCARTMHVPAKVVRS